MGPAKLKPGREHMVSNKLYFLDSDSEALLVWGFTAIRFASRGQNTGSGLPEPSALKLLNNSLHNNYLYIT